MVSEMIHTASLIHDDVIDGANTRRGKVSVNTKFGEKMSVLAADYILSCASKTLAQLGNAEVVKLLAKVVDDLIKGIELQLVTVNPKIKVRQCNVTKLMRKHHLLVRTYLL